MSKTVGQIFTEQSPAELFAGRRVNEGPYSTLLSNVNYLYATSGARCPLLVRDTPFTTTSATQTQTDASADLIDLDRYQGLLRCTRPLDLSGDSYRIQVRMLGENIECEVRVFDLSTNTSLGTITVTQNTTAALVVRNSLDLSTAEAIDTGEPRVLLLSIVGAKFTSGDGGSTGYLWGLHGFEAIGDSSTLP